MLLAFIKPAGIARLLFCKFAKNRVVLQFSNLHYSAFSYDVYMALMEELVNYKSTTGSNQSPENIQFTALNLQRMKRLNKRTILRNELKQLLSVSGPPMTWLVLTEAWCGDAAQSLPVINKMAEFAQGISLRLVLRDENPELMEAHLTNGTRSIPKLICLDNDLLEIGEWGPRPAPAQQLLLPYKAGKISKTAFLQELHSWYAKDNTFTLQAEFLELIRDWRKKAVPK